MNVTIFYSWQSDTKTAANRSFIQEALEAAASELRSDASIEVQPVVDRDTFAIAGSPDIGTTILSKIDSCHVFVADVTIVNNGSSHRAMSNPNVMIELGYAFKAVGPSRIILIQNVAFGGPEKLPFDLRQKRVLTYDSPVIANDRSTERRKLKKILCEALRLMLMEEAIEESLCPLRPEITFEKVNITSDLHNYRLLVNLVNDSSLPVFNWHLDVGMPTDFLDAHMTHAQRVPERSNRVETLFRSSESTHGGAIYPGDKRTALTVEYHVNNSIYSRRNEWMNLPVTARVYVDGEIAEVKRMAKEIECF